MNTDSASREKRPSRPIESLLYPLSELYRGLMRGRDFAFDREYLKTRKVAKPVVSIGNITAGGTGKTPLTALLVEGFKARGSRVGLISRGYGGSLKGPARVPADGSVETAKLFGDETSWLAHRYPDVPVVIARKRVAAAEFLLAHHGVDLILADDAFQHRWLGRDLDAVVLDPTEPSWHYRALPLGRAREGFEALRRAHAIFITKTNLADESRVNWLRRRIKRTAQAYDLHPMVFELESKITKFIRLGDESQTRTAEEFRGEKVLLLSGIGRPHTFVKLVRQASKGLEVLEHLVFNDHHSYTRSNLEDIEIRAVRLGASAILMTEKDAVKISDWRPRIPAWASRLETSSKTDLGSFYESVHRLLV